MNNNNLKKRRPYCHDDVPAEPVLQDPSQSFQIGPDATPSLSAQYQYILGQAASTNVRLSVPLSKLLDLGRQDNQRYILEQAAFALNVPLPLLLESSRQQHLPRKRPRLNSVNPMPSPFPSSPAAQDAQEKPLLSGHPGREGGRGSYAVLDGEISSSGWSGSRLANCFTSFSMCPPCSPYEAQATYQPLPTTASYDYGSPRSGALCTSGPMQSQGHESFDPPPVNAAQSNLFSCDDTIVGQYLQAYPSLQPSRVMGLQPSTSSESMIYPESLSNNKYMGGADDSRGATGLGIQVTQAGIATGRSHGMAPTFPTELDSPEFARSNPFMMPQRYDLLQAYGASSEPYVKADSDAMDPRRPGYDSVFPNQRTPSARRGPFRDHDQRERTAYTRKIGSCIRCRMQRIRCNLDPRDEAGPCLTCKRVANNNKVWRLSCLRWKITDVRLFKPGQVKGHEWTDRWRDSVVDDIGSWASSDIRTISVTEGYTGRAVKLLVRRFQPQEGDRLERSWVSGGVRKSVPIPPYAIVDMEAARSSFDDYIKKGLVECCEKLLGPRHKLLYKTYTLAMALMGDAGTHEKERELLRSTLDLWMSIRLTTKSFEIVGDDTLGMPRNLIDDESNSLHGKIPLPPVMGAQIDSVLIHQVQPFLRRKTLEELQKMTQEKKPMTWLTTYLVTFILLHNIALITKHDAEYARKHGMKRRFAREDKVREYNIGANTLLAYFHYCNKGVYPFSQECKDQDLQTLAALRGTSLQFVHYTRQYAGKYRRQWEESWENEDYENEYYYVSQLFEQNWQPRTMV